MINPPATTATVPVSNHNDDEKPRSSPLRDPLTTTPVQTPTASPQPTTLDDKPQAPIPPPDTGITAYLQILGGFLLMFNAWGLVLSYGTFQAYYSTSATSPFTESPSGTAWIGSIQAFLLLFMGGICGRLFDAGHLRLLLLTGSTLIVFGLMMASLARVYWQALLSQGLCVGFGLGCLLVPSVGGVSTWFERRRGMAVGVVTSGSAAGGIVLPIVCQKLLPRVGFGWTLRILGFVSLATLGVSIAVMKQRLPPRKRGGFFAFGALREPPFLCYVLGMLVAMLGFYVFLQFVQSWAEATSLSSFPPIYYLPIINGASVLGRAFPSLLADYVGPLNVQIPCALASAVLAYAWIGIHSLGPLLTVAILYGFFSGGMLALPPAAVASLTTDMTHFGSRMGLCFVFMAVGSLVGTPVTGAIVGGRSKQGNWDGARVWSGTTIALGGLLMVLARWFVSRREGKRWLKV